MSVQVTRVDADTQRRERPAGTVAGDVAVRMIVGMPRAGTTWLCRTLNEHPDCAAFGQSHFWGKAHVARGKSGLYGPEELAEIRARLARNPLNVTIGREGPGWLKRLARQDIPRLVERALPDNAAPLRPGEAFWRLCAEVAKAEGKTCAVEKTPSHVSSLRAALADMPDLRVVVMIRDPYKFMLSYKHQGDRKSAENHEHFRRRYHPIGAAIIWRSAWRHGEHARRVWPEQVLILRLEDVERDRQKAVGDVLAFYGLRPAPIADRLPKVNSSFLSETVPSLSSADVFWMNVVAGRDIRRAGYALAPTPGAVLPTLGSLAIVPVWTFRVLREKSRKVGRAGVRYLARHVFAPQRSRIANSARKPVAPAAPTGGRSAPRSESASTPLGKGAPK